MSRHVLIGALGRTIGWVFLQGIPFCAALAGNPGSIPGMAPTSGPVGLPSIGRVLLVFVFIVALAIGMLFALRRFQPQWTKHLAGNSSIRVLERTTLGTVRIYLLQVEGRKLLLTEHRNAMSLLPLEGGDQHARHHHETTSRE